MVWYEVLSPILTIYSYSSLNSVLNDTTPETLLPLYLNFKYSNIDEIEILPINIQIMSNI